MKIELKRADSIVEAGALCAFAAEVFSPSDRFSPEDWADYDVFWIYAGDERAGIIALMPHRTCGVSYDLDANAPGCLWITEIMIAPEFQNKGIGTAALTLAVQWARLTGFAKMSSNCRVGNRASIGLHQKAGFAVTRTIEDYYKGLVEDALALSLALVGD